MSKSKLILWAQPLVTVLIVVAMWFVLRWAFLPAVCYIAILFLFRWELSKGTGNGAVALRKHMASPIIKYFAYEHLNPTLQLVSKDLCELARKLDENLPDGAEKSTGLRKLLEAKDCFVRAKLG